MTMLFKILPRSIVLAFALALASADAALAQLRPPEHKPDVTVFSGLITGRAARRSSGWTLGGGGSAVRFELEYARSTSNGAKDAPAVATMMINLLVQSSQPRGRIRFYGTAGLGLWGESFVDGHDGGEAGYNLGGGAKITIAGPLAARLDYRVFLFRGSPDGAPSTPTPHRLSAGLTFGF